MPIIRGKNALTNPKLLQMMETGNACIHTFCTEMKILMCSRGIQILSWFCFQMEIFRMGTPWVLQISRQTCPPRCPSLCWMYWSSLFTIIRFTSWHYTQCVCLSLKNIFLTWEASEYILRHKIKQRTFLPELNLCCCASFGVKCCVHMTHSSCTFCSTLPPGGDENLFLKSVHFTWKL